MKIELCYLAGISDITGKTGEVIELEDMRVGSLLEKLIKIYGQPLRKIFQSDEDGEWHCMLMVGSRILFPYAVDQQINPGEKIIILPPVSGG